MSERFVSDTDGRLDEFLRDKLPGTGRARAKKLCTEGKVFVNGRKAAAGLFIAPGDTILIDEMVQEVRARPELGRENTLNVLFEDEYLLAVSKPRCMHSVTLSEDDPLTVADCLAAIASSCAEASNDPREAGLVQRLDYYTSGVILAAKRREVWEKLHQAMQGDSVEKSYRALVEGSFPEQEILVNSSLVSSSGGRVMRAAEPGEAGLAAQTRFSLLEATNEQVSLVAAKAPGARRHQVRAHAAICGHPLVGDVRYGATKKLSDCAEPYRSFAEGFYLHAESISFLHPVSGERVIVVAG